MTSKSTPPPSRWKLIDLGKYSDSRGGLTVIEDRNFQNIFNIKRIFFQTESKSNMVRGGHAHKICHQLIIAVVGTFTCKVFNFNESETLQIDANGPSLYVPPLTWIEQYSFSENCVVAVLASHYYDEEDYIRNFTSFMDLKTNVYRKRP